MKKLMRIFSVVFTTVIMTTSIFAANNISVTVNGSQVNFDVAPQIINGRTMVPLRAIFESMGATVAWNNETKTITAIKDDKTVQMTVDSPIIYIDGTSKEMDISPTVIDNRTLVPARFVAEAFDANVSWNAETSTVVISDDESDINMSQLINPSEDFVITKLKTIPVITEIQAATEDNDPNGKLHKVGGYTSAVYFSTSYVDQSGVNGDDIVDKGTKCGGQIEVYANENDANTRDKYLSIFNGGVIDSGYHEVFGTMVIRVSDKCTATQQKEVVQLIKNAFISGTNTNITETEEISNTSKYTQFVTWLKNNGNNVGDSYMLSGKKDTYQVAIMYMPTENYISIYYYETTDSEAGNYIYIKPNDSQAECKMEYKSSSPLIGDIESSCKIDMSSFSNDTEMLNWDGLESGGMVSELFTGYTKLSLSSAQLLLKDYDCPLSLSDLGFTNF